MIKLPFIGRYLSFFLNPLKFFAMVFQQQGNVAIIDFGILGKIYYLFDPDDVEKFFTEGKRVHRDRFNKLFGNGLFTLESGPQAIIQRNLLKKSFNTLTLENMASIIVSHSQELFLECSKHQKGVCLTKVIKPLIRKLQLTLILGSIKKHEENHFLKCLDTIFCYLNREFTTLIRIPDNWPTLSNRKFQKSLRELKMLIENKIHSSTLENNQLQTFGILPSLLEMMRADKENTLTKSSVCDEILSLLIAGTETSSAIVIWMLHLLANSPKVQESLRAEIHEKSPINSNIKFHDLSNFTFSRCVVQETLRLYPPAWAMIRNFKTPLKTKTHEIPAGSTAWAIPYITHRHTEFWDEPEEFRPERFEIGRHQARSKFAFYPFAGGGHRCIAERFVMTQAQLIAAVVGRDYKLTAVTSKKLQPKVGIALMPAIDPYVIFTKQKTEKDKSS